MIVRLLLVRLRGMKWGVLRVVWQVYGWFREGSVDGDGIIV